MDPPVSAVCHVFSFAADAASEAYALSLHDALPILTMPEAKAKFPDEMRRWIAGEDIRIGDAETYAETASRVSGAIRDRKSTRLNSSHVAISYAVFCLKKEKIWSRLYYDALCW